MSNFLAKTFFYEQSSKLLEPSPFKKYHIEASTTPFVPFTNILDYLVLRYKFLISLKILHVLMIFFYKNYPVYFTIEICK